jgi:hypothetical protein
MLLYGTANPEGFGSESYEGLYLTVDDIDRITPQMVNIPVKVEHTVSAAHIFDTWSNEHYLTILTSH